MIKIVTFSELVSALTEDNNLFGAITFSDKGWREKEGGYSLEESTFIFSGTNKYFGDYCGNSCFASDLTGIDQCIRLEQCWGTWDTKACFIMSKDDIDRFKRQIHELQEAGLKV